MMAMLKHQLKIAYGDNQKILNAFLTLGVVLVIFAMILEQNKGILASEILLVMTYVILSLSINGLFEDDIRSGFIDAYIASSKSLEFWVVKKTLSFWLLNLLPLLLIAFLFCYSMHCPQILTVMLMLVLSSFIVVMLGALGSVLVLEVRNNSFLLPLISLPIMIPSLLIALGVLNNGASSSYIKIMIALCFIAVALSWSMTPFAIRIVLR